MLAIPKRVSPTVSDHGKIPLQELTPKRAPLGFLSVWYGGRADCVALRIDHAHKPYSRHKSQSNFKGFEFNFASKRGFIHFFLKKQAVKFYFKKSPKYETGSRYSFQINQILSDNDT